MPTKHKDIFQVFVTVMYFKKKNSDTYSIIIVKFTLSV